MYAVIRTASKGLLVSNLVWMLPTQDMAKAFLHKAWEDHCNDKCYSKYITDQTYHEESYAVITLNKKMKIEFFIADIESDFVCEDFLNGDWKRYL